MSRTAEIPQMRRFAKIHFQMRFKEFPRTQSDPALLQVKLLFVFWKKFGRKPAVFVRSSLESIMDRGRSVAYAASDSKGLRDNSRSVIPRHD
jgi:hypothetical protein